MSNIPLRIYTCADVWRVADGRGWEWKRSFTRREVMEILPGITLENLDRLDHDNDGHYCER